MYSKILVPLDGSKLSEGILPYARSMVKALNIPVELLVVIGPEVISTFTDPGRGRYVDVVEADMKRNSLEYLKTKARSFPVPSHVTCSTEIGSAAEAIVEKGSADSDTLIAMATHGRSGVQRWLLGSVADKVLRATANPLLLVRSVDGDSTEGGAMLKKIVVPLDGSQLAETVLPHVKPLAQEMGLAVVLLRVYSLLTGGYMVEAEAYTPALDKILEEIKAEATTYLEEKTRQLTREGLKNVSYMLLEGDAAGGIIDFARKTPDNLIGMCTHGRSGVGRWMLGSVTDRVVRHGGDPVLIVRAAARA
ncbi:MAG: universal stress protein [Deltaproteobacteria bacterium]|nr:universal stress protein [Deltaproteobacteria bacterium]